MTMLLNNFKVAGFKTFGEVVELNLKTDSKNTNHLKENLIENNIGGLINKNVKSAIIYGGNNTGKSSLLDALYVMKKIFKNGHAEKFPFEVLKNFTCNFDGVIRFEVDFNDSINNYCYGIEFEDTKNIGEYLYLNDTLLFSRDLNGEVTGEYMNKDIFKINVGNLPYDKLIVSYFLEYQKNLTGFEELQKVNDFFNKLSFISNKDNSYNIVALNKFMRDSKKVRILNELIKSTELYLEERIMIDEKDLFNEDFIDKVLESELVKDLNKEEKGKKTYKEILDSFRITSVYKTTDGLLVNKPSLLFDSIGTNNYLRLSMHIINALLEGKILLIDEFDSSLHFKLTRILTILMNSEANKNSQFILTTHDVNLLSNELFRKDQVNFIVRDNNDVDIISLNDFKANSEDKDIRNTSNFEKMYIEEKIVPLPSTNIYNVIKEFIDE